MDYRFRFRYVIENEEFVLTMYDDMGNFLSSRSFKDRPTTTEREQAELEMQEALK